jgi:hypothetical protein
MRLTPASPTPLFVSSAAPMTLLDAGLTSARRTSLFVSSAAPTKLLEEEGTNAI